MVHLGLLSLGFLSGGDKGATRVRISTLIPTGLGAAMAIPVVSGRVLSAIDTEVTELLRHLSEEGDILQRLDVQVSSDFTVALLDEKQVEDLVLECCPFRTLLLRSALGKIRATRKLAKERTVQDFLFGHRLDFSGLGNLLDLSLGLAKRLLAGL